MRADLKKIFRDATAVIAFGFFGAAGGCVGYQQFGAAQLDKKETPAAVVYETRLKALAERQSALDSTNDEEAAAKLAAAKRIFVADVMLDTALTEKDVGALALKFNPLADEDSDAFAAAKDDKSLAQRSECLADISLTRNRTETAQRVDDCMKVYAQQETEATKTAAGLGGLAGAGLAISFLLGRASRRKDAPAAKP
jgi:predicted negative regulator of RcsB-dependent stress response